MSNPDERHQATALLATTMVFCLWASHAVSVHFPHVPGTVDLRTWVKFWNQPLIVHWPSALVLFALSLGIAKRIQRKMTAIALRRQQREARWLKNQAQNEPRNPEHRPIQ